MHGQAKSMVKNGMVERGNGRKKMCAKGKEKRKEKKTKKNQQKKFLFGSSWGTA